MTGATTGGQGQFSYDFGIAIAQGTVNKLARLAGVTLTLAAAYHSLMEYSTEYISTLKTSALQFGGYTKTLLTMEQAQRRLIEGQTTFSVDDQMKGMRQLMVAGINVKKNFDFINKSAHAMGASFKDFSGAISQGIQGNMNGLVEMGLLTQRAVRMFEKYPANTVMRQQAVVNFVRSHKGLQTLIKNDFYTIQDQMLRLKEVWKAFLKSIVGDPRDPTSFYGKAVSTLKFVADSFARNMVYIKRAGFVTSKVLGWFISKVGNFSVWMGRKIKNN